MERYGIIAFAFGYRKNDPGLSNRALARVVERLLNDYPDAVIVVQHEIMECLQKFLGTIPNNVFGVWEHKNPGQYLDSKEVMRQASSLFNMSYVKSVFVVAQPFLQLRSNISLVEKAGFDPIIPRNMKIPFDRKSEQKWARSRTNLLKYTIRQKVFGRKR